MKKLHLIYIFLVFTQILPLYANSTPVQLEAKSKINWIKKEFTSNINLDIDKTNIAFPQGKNVVLNKIQQKLPLLIKDPLLTINVDSENKLLDVILDQELSYKQVENIISSSKCTIGRFTNKSSIYSTDHNIDVTQISSLLVKHKTPYKLQKPINYVSSKKYTGIIIDARGTLPVHGEFVQDKVNPCLFPKVYSSDMELFYEKNMVDSVKSKESGICNYDYSDNLEKYINLIGNEPLYIVAQKTFGQNRSDLIIKNEDALKITSIAENLNLIKEGKVVILLEKEKLIYDVSSPIKDEMYYTILNKVKLYPVRELLGPDKIENGPDGIKFLYNLKFVPDSPELLQEEKPRIEECAKLLKEALKDSAYTIFVAGHTADIGQPENQMILSIQRTQTIIDALVNEGIQKNIFTYRGYGATIPAEGGDNSTPEGMAVNRRVEITLRPRTTYIQRTSF